MKTKSNLAMLKEIANLKAVKDFHKNLDLEFTAMHRLDFDRMDKTLKIYKSPTYNMRQSSCYWVGINNGRIYYIRKSNHWGRFYVNSGAVDESCPYECQLPVTHNWELINGKRRKDGEYTNTSQIGIIDITDLVGNKIIRR